MIKANKKAMFLHTYPKEREPITAVKCVYTGDGGGNKKADMVIAETPLFDFENSSSKDLGWPFDVIESYNHIPQIVLALPNNFANGKGKGYILDLMDYAKERGYHVFNAKVRYHQFGAPIQGTSMFMVLSVEPMSPAKSITTTEISAGKWFPEIITHAANNPGNIAFVSGAGTMNGFLKSNIASFPEIAMWGGNLLMCERKAGSSLSLSRLSLEEVSKIFGMAVTESTDLPYLLKAVPLVVYDTFIKRFMMD
jgi:hypothetical protein